MAVFVLLHSPSVGPATWLPVAGRLQDMGEQAVVPSLVRVGDGEPPYWPRVVAAVTASLGGLGRDQPLVLVAHSNAGLLMPVIVAGLVQHVSCCIFADASVPAASPSVPLAEDAFLPFLRDLTGPDGRLPRWTDWWSDADTAALFPDERTRQIVTDEQPRLPLRYFLEQVPVPEGWDNRPCGYLMFSPAYEDQAGRAADRGWPVLTEPGEHLHQLVNPDRVSRALAELARPGPAEP